MWDRRRRGGGFVSPTVGPFPFSALAFMEKTLSPRAGGAGRAE